MQNEIFKAIPECKQYKISNFGRVFSYKSNIYLKENYKNGYAYINLYYNGKSHHAYIHKLVAKSFLENTNSLPEINHKDENKLNNHVDNLEWCDRLYNNNYGTHNKRMSETKSIKIAQISFEGELVKIYNSLKEIDECTDYNGAVVWQACTKNVKQVYGFIWMYYKEYMEASNNGNKKIDIDIKSDRKRSIICVTTNEIFESMSNAALKYLGHKQTSHIFQCCNGDRNFCGKHPETGEKLVWRYYDEED